MAKFGYIMHFLRIFNRHHKTSIINTSVQQHRSTLTSTKNRARQRGLFLGIIPNNRQKEQLQIIIFGWCLVFFASCRHGHRGASDNHERLDTHVRSDGKDEGLGLNSDKPHKAPNGLGNNNYRCYANAALQLLAACFSEEIKSMQPFSNDNEKEQMRIDLCTIVDHINAPEKRDPTDSKVLRSVCNLTGEDETSTGGHAYGFLGSLIKALGFYPGCELVLYTHQDTFKLENNIMSDLTPQDLLLRQKIDVLDLPNFSDIVYFYYEEGLALQHLLSGNGIFFWQFEDDQALKKYFELRSRKCIDWVSFDEFKAFKEFKEGINRRYSYWCEKPAYYKIRFTKLKNKLPTGTKLLTIGNGRKQYKELALPYGQGLDWQNFDLVGFIVWSNNHYFTYIKREGTWYKANDSIISTLSEGEIDNVLNACCAITYTRVASVYKAR